MQNMLLQNKNIIGMDIGGTNCRIAVVDEKLSISKLKVINSREIFYSDDSAAMLSYIIDSYIKNELEGKLPDLISIGFPSVLDKTRKKLISTTNLNGLTNINIVSILKEKLKTDVIIEHDAYYLLAYDIKKHNIKTNEAVIGCYFGTGYGNAIYINRKPYIGNNGMACETGHIPIDIDEDKSRICTCGNRGCIEAYSCGLALEDISKNYYPNDNIEDIFKYHSNDFQMDNFLKYMALSVSSLINILDPYAVFLGGGIINMNCFPKDRFLKYINSHIRKTSIERNIKIIFSENDNNQNGIIGAAIFGFDYLNN